MNLQVFIENIALVWAIFNLGMILKECWRRVTYSMALKERYPIVVVDTDNIKMKCHYSEGKISEYEGGALFELMAKDIQKAIEEDEKNNCNFTVLTTNFLKPYSKYLSKEGLNDEQLECLRLRDYLSTKDAKELFQLERETKVFVCKCIISSDDKRNDKGIVFWNRIGLIVYHKRWAYTKALYEKNAIWILAAANIMLITMVIKSYFY